MLIRVIKQNYAWAVGFNTAGIALATAGFLSPWLAAVFHHVSSVLVVANSGRLAFGKSDRL
jgi:cation transport ATPase